MHSSKKNKEGDIISQCPECLDLSVRYPNSYGSKVVPSMVVFGKIPKVLCLKCVARFKI